MWLLDLVKQVRRVLLPANGGTGNPYGNSATIRAMQNATGSSLAVGTLVQLLGSWDDTRVIAVTAADSTAVVGIVVGGYDDDGVTFVPGAAADNGYVAVLVAGAADVLLGQAVTRGQYAYSHTTDGTAKSSATLSAGAFGIFEESAASGSARVRISAGPQGPAGATGATGAAGAAGAPGGLHYTFDTGTSGSGIGSGELRVNNASWGSATELYISETDADGLNQAGYMNTWDDSSSQPPMVLIIREPSAPTILVVEVNSVTDSGTYRTLGITVLAFGSTPADAATLYVMPSRTGDAGGLGGVYVFEDSDVPGTGTANIGPVHALATNVGTYTFAKAGSIVAIAARIGNARTAGTLTFQADLPDSAGPAGPIATIDATNTLQHYASQAPGVTNFSAGERVRIRATGSSFTPTTADALVQLLVAFNVQVGGGGTGGATNGLALYGDGNDGDATLDGSTNYNNWSSRSGSTYTMTRDAQLNALTINSGVILDPAGFRLAVKGTCTINGTLRRIPNAGSGATAGGGLSNSSKTVGGSPAGGAGANAASANGTAGGNSSNSGGGAGGAGGDANSGGRTGGAGGTVSLVAGTNQYRSLPQAASGQAVTGQSAVSMFQGGAGGGGGANNTASGGNFGGGGGGGGGVLILAAKDVVLDSAGAIEAKGGNGGNAAGATGGGGGGGGGGLIIIIADTFDESGTVSAAGGTAGTGAGTGSNGSNGSAGNIVRLVAA